MNKKGQRTFNNENVHRIKMLGLSSVLSVAAGHLSSSRKSYWQLARSQKLRPKWDKMGAIHSTEIQTGPTGKRGPPQKVDLFFRNFSGWTEPIHWVLDRNFRKFWLNGSRPKTAMHYEANQCSSINRSYLYLQGTDRHKHSKLLHSLKIRGKNKL